MVGILAAMTIVASGFASAPLVLDFEQSHPILIGTSSSLPQITEPVVWAIVTPMVTPEPEELTDVPYTPQSGFWYDFIHLPQPPQPPQPQSVVQLSPILGDISPMLGDISPMLGGY